MTKTIHAPLALTTARQMRAARRSFRVCGPVLHTGKATSGLLALLLMHGMPAKADIWGFVDAERMPHFAASQLDERYVLLLRDTVEPFQRISPPVQTPVEAPALPNPPLAAAVSRLPGAGGAGQVSARQLAFFEQSKNYKTASPLLREAAKTHGIDYSLLKALIATESGFNSYAVSPKGAVGLMQLIPPTAERYGVTAGKGGTIESKLTDPKINIRAGARYLADLIKMFPGRLELALAAYNAGEGAVQRAGNKIPNYPETQNYVKTVMQLYTGLARLPPNSAGVRAALETRETSLGRGSLASPVEPVAFMPR